MHKKTHIFEKTIFLRIRIKAKTERGRLLTVVFDGKSRLQRLKVKLVRSTCDKCPDTPMAANNISKTIKQQYANGVSVMYDTTYLYDNDQRIVLQWPENILVEDNLFGVVLFDQTSYFGSVQTSLGRDGSTGVSGQYGLVRTIALR